MEGLTLATSDGETLISESQLAVHRGRRYALVGPNGSGKSTLLQAIADGALPGWPTRMTTALVSQEGAASKISVLQSLLEAKASALHLTVFIEEAKRLETELDDDTQGAIELKANRLGEIHAMIEAMTGPQAERKAHAILAGLQFPSAEIMASELSGGWRQRLALAQALFIQPDVLLLDEPSNHLDMLALRWLVDHLLTTKSTALVVSHDQHFLKAVSTDTLSIESETLVHTAAPYDIFLNLREQRGRRDQGVLAAAEAKEAKLQAIAKQQELDERAHARSMSSQVGRDPHFARAARVAADRGQTKQAVASKAAIGKKLSVPIVQSARCGWSADKVSAAEVKERLLARQSLERSLPLYFNAATPLGHKVCIQLDDATLGRAGTAVLGGLNLRVGERARIAILGANGVGKSTLLEALKGHGDVSTAPANWARGQTIVQPPSVDSRVVETIKGEVSRHGRLRVAFMSQHVADEMEADLDTACWEYLAKRLACTELRARHLLGAVGLGGSHIAHRALRNLSGGERTRMIFASEILPMQPHLLLLDEPTNHLDLEGVEALLAAIEGFDGAVVCVSHQRHFVASFARELWHVQQSQQVTSDSVGRVEVHHAEDSRAVEQIIDRFWVAADAVTNNQALPRPLPTPPPPQPTPHLRRPAPESTTAQPEACSGTAAAVPASQAGVRLGHASTDRIASASSEIGFQAAAEHKLATKKAAERVEKKAAKAAKAAKHAVLNCDADAHKLQSAATALAREARHAMKVAEQAAAKVDEIVAAAAAAREHIEMGLSKWEAIELENRRRQAAAQPSKKVWVKSQLQVDDAGFQSVVRPAETTLLSESSDAEKPVSEHPSTAGEEAVSVEAMQLMDAMGISAEGAVQKLHSAEGDLNRAIDLCLQELS